MPVHRTHNPVHVYRDPSRPDYLYTTVEQDTQTHIDITWALSLEYNKRNTESHYYPVWAGVVGTLASQQPGYQFQVGSQHNVYNTPIHSGATPDVEHTPVPPPRSARAFAGEALTDGDVFLFADIDEQSAASDVFSAATPDASRALSAATPDASGTLSAVSDVTIPLPRAEGSERYIDVVLSCAAYSSSGTVRVHHTILCIRMFVAIEVKPYPPRHFGATNKQFKRILELSLEEARIQVYIQVAFYFTNHPDNIGHVHAIAACGLRWSTRILSRQDFPAGEMERIVKKGFDPIKLGYFPNAARGRHWSQAYKLTTKASTVKLNEMRNNIKDHITSHF
jgi:hypothetical protein